MEHSSRFFENKDCQYYPCHRSTPELNCLFCYCPFYLWENCPGAPEYWERNGKPLKVCTNCNFPHKPENYDTMMRLLRDA